MNRPLPEILNPESREYLATENKEVSLPPRGSFTPTVEIIELDVRTINGRARVGQGTTQPRVLYSVRQGEKNA